MTLDFDSVPPILRLEPLGAARYQVSNEGDPAINNVVFGGQLLAQMIIAAVAHSSDKFSEDHQCDLCPSCPRRRRNWKSQSRLSIRAEPSRATR